MSTSFGKDPHNPRHGGETNIGGGSSNITKTGSRDPHNPRWPTIIKADKIVVKGGDHDISDGTGWGIKHLSGSMTIGGWDARDTNIPKHEVPKNGDDQYDARTKEWLDGNQESIILKVDGDFYISGNDHYDASTEYGGRTSEDISDGSTWFGPVGPGPGYISGHTSTFGGDGEGQFIPVLWKTEKDFGVSAEYDI